MRNLFAAAATWLCAPSFAVAFVCASALAQQAASPTPPIAPTARTAGPPTARTAGPPKARGTSATTNAGNAGATGSRGAPIYRVELVVFRAKSALGSPEDWAAEAGAGPATSADADSTAPTESGQPPGSASNGSEPAGGQAGAPSDGTQPNAVRPDAAQPNAAPRDAAPPNGALPASVVRLLPSSEFQMDGVASRLRASGRYVPVAHIAWAQTASPWRKPVDIPVQSLGLDAQGLTGSVALERGQFLHLALDLRYMMSDPPPGLGAPPRTVFVLNQSHRVRFHERNYFDHPAFGVIALVTSDETAKGAGR